jgi:hypothetical protein
VVQSSISSILQRQPDFKTLEQEIWEATAAAARAELTAVLEALDAAVMALLEQAIAEGLTARAACAVLGLSERRWRERRRRASAGDYERHPKPASVRPYNALTAPDTSFVSGSNQLWAWDIKKLRTGIPHRFWFLYAVLDQWSRKVVGWP